MTLRNSPLAIVLILLAACAEPPAPPEQQFIEDIATALGGRSAVEAVNTFAMEGEGRMLNVGQDMTPEAETMVFDISDYRLSADLANGRSHTSLVRTPLFDYFRGRDPMQLVSGLDGNVAYDVGPDGTSYRSHDDVAADRRATYFHHPLPLIRAALTGDASVGNVRTEDGLAIADISTADGKTFTIATDPDTHLPVSIHSTDHHFYLRDIDRTTRFSDYEEAGDLVLPSTMSQSLDEFPAFSLDVTNQQPNADIGDISAPDSVASAPAVSGTPPANVTADALAEGVWLLGGQSHHSVLVEFGDHLVVIEAPNEARVLAVLEKAEELVPGKPVTRVVNTHHHFDHSGGIRTAVAKGLTIVTHELNEAFYRRMAEQPSTIHPDSLAASPRPIDLDVIRDRKVYEDETMTLEVYHVDGNPHSSSILMAYLPDHQLLVQVDLYTPGRTTPQLFAPNLLDNIRSHRLQVERIVPLHGTAFEIQELDAAVQALRN
jgi:glyoxylase-like metal-dependent hydrolase (beta-lactamase superfamily II)